ncbi:MAG TPA: VOC family protein [Candidatus Acidoferrales bacterium]
MSVRLAYAILFVADMERAVKFYRDTVGFPLRFQSPHWTEFSTGATTLALHIASEQNPAGMMKMGVATGDLQAFYNDMKAKGVEFTMPPTKQDFGGELAEFKDADGARITASGM